MKKFITVHKKNDNIRVIVAVDDISAIFEEASTTICFKSDTNFELKVRESLDEIYKLIK